MVQRTDKAGSADETTSVMISKTLRWLEEEMRKRRSSRFFGSIVIEIPFNDGQINVVKRNCSDVVKAHDEF